MSKQTAIAIAKLKESMLDEKFKGAIKDAIPQTLTKIMTPERMTKIALNVLQKNDKLAECTKTSIMRSIIEAANLGLEINTGPLARAHLVPYYNKKTGVMDAQLILDYKGLIELARRSGKISRINSYCVYANDVFEYELGLDPKIVHKPILTGERGDIIAAYTVAHFTDGSQHFELMTKEELDAIRKRGASKYGPWSTDYAEMAKKTVVRRAAKYWPLQIDVLNTALEVEDRAETGHSKQIVDVDYFEDSPPEVSTTDAVLSLVEQGHQEDEVVAPSKSSPAPAPTQTVNPDSVDMPTGFSEPKTDTVNAHWRHARDTACDKFGREQVNTLHAAMDFPIDFKTGWTDQMKQENIILWELVKQHGYPTSDIMESFRTILIAEIDAKFGER